MGGRLGREVREGERAGGRVGGCRVPPIGKTYTLHLQVVWECMTLPCQGARGHWVHIFTTHLCISWYVLIVNDAIILTKLCA